MAPDDALHEAFVRQMIEPAVFAVALTGRIDERQVAGRVGETAGRAGEKRLLDRDGDLFRETDADETAGCDRVARTDQPHRLGRRHDLSFFRRAQEGQGGVVGHFASRLVGA